MKDETKTDMGNGIEAGADAGFEADVSTDDKAGTATGAKAGETTSLQEKLARLRGILSQMGSVAVSFSGGVDSTLLLAVAHQELGDGCLAVTATTPTMPSSEQQDARAFCTERGIRQVELSYNEIQDVEGFAQNPTNRCYLCKTKILSEARRVAKREGISWVAEGSNLDDLGDYRPGLQAVAEQGVRSPLREAGFTKADIRAASRELGLPSWDKPAAACLSSRFPYWQRITEERLRMVDAAEAYLHGLGFRQCRVRIHGEKDPLARVEVEAGMIDKAAGSAEEISSALRDLGFAYVTLDLRGFRSGSMNEVL